MKTEGKFLKRENVALYVRNYALYGICHCLPYVSYHDQYHRRAASGVSKWDSGCRNDDGDYNWGN